MIGTIRRHQSWLWAIIITLTIGSFVVFGPTNTRMGNNIMSSFFGSRKPEFGVLAGQPISREAFNSARNEVAIDLYFKNRQQWPNFNSVDFEREVYWRLMIIQRQKDYGVQVSPDAITALARHFFPPNPAAVDEFTDTILKPKGLDLTDFENFLRHELGLEQILMASGVTGKLVTPGDAEAMYRLENRDLDSAIVLFSASNYLSSVTMTPDGVAEFYTNQVANYRVPDQVVVDYVKFPATNYSSNALALLTNLDKYVDSEVEHLGTNLYHGAKTPAESRDAIRREVITQASVVQAHKAAEAFAESLDAEKAHTLDTFKKFAGSNHLAVMVTEPFEREYGPQDLKLPPAFAQKAFTLTADEPFGGPIKSDDAVYVMALVERQPSRTPPLKEIETKVTADFRYAKAYQLAQQSAIKFSSTASNGMAAGKSFSALCAQAGLRSESLPLFSRNSRSLSDAIEEHVNLDLLKRVAFNTPPGKVSPPASASDGAFIIYVERVLPVDEAKMKAQLPAYLTQLRQLRENDAFQQWFFSQLKQDPEFYQYVTSLGQEQMKSVTARTPKS